MYAIRSYYGAVDVIRALVTRAKGAVVGAGTVLDADSARACIDAGARFIVSPSFDPGTIAACGGLCAESFGEAEIGPAKVMLFKRDNLQACFPLA